MNRTRSRRSRLKKGLCIAVASVLLFVVLSMGSSVVVFSLLFARVDASDPWEVRYSDLDAARYPRREASFYSGKNELRGYWYPAPDPKGTVIVANGLYSTADSHLPEAAVFVDHGWQVLLYDNTGVGRSDGAGVGGLPQAKRDLLAAVDFVRRSPEGKDLPLFLYGHSTGGYAAAAALSSAEGVTGAVCVAGFDSPVQMMHWHARQKVGILADVEYPFLWLQNRFLFGSDGDASALDGINSTAVPVAVVQGADDEVVPAPVSIARLEDRFTNPNARVTVIDLPGRSGHSTLWLSADAAEYRRQLSENGDAGGDRLRANAPDPEFMEFVLSFFDAALK